MDLKGYQFRHLHPLVFLGTASDRYAGWLGQIYTPELYRGRIQRRTKRLAQMEFVEELLPVESVKEYFRHFRVLELDFTFYSPLLDRGGAPTANLRLLELYCTHLGREDLVLLKAPQAVTAQRLRTAEGFIPNPNYLAPEVFTKGFYEPASEILGQHLAGIILEQEYQPKAERRDPEKVAQELEGFFRAIPRDARYHLELRTQQYLTESVFQVMESQGVGQVLSHWTWLPPLRRQLAASGGRFLKRGRACLIRLMTPLGVRYEEAYARAHPFDGMVEGMLQPGMVEETARIMCSGVKAGAELYVIVNNRAGGNAPQIARMVAQRFLELMGVDSGKALRGEGKDVSSDEALG